MKIRVMDFSHLVLAAGVVTACVCIAPAEAKDRSETVRFAKGAHAKTIKSRIVGDNGVNYLVKTSSGQAMQLLFSSTGGTCYMNVYEPGATDTAAHIGSTAGNEFGRSPTMAGTYRVQVYQMRSGARRNAACRFSLSVELTGGSAAATSAPAKAASPVTEQTLREQCLAATLPMYGVGKGAVMLGPEMVKTSSGGFALEGTVDKGSEGIKKMRCLYKPNRTFSNVEAMTSDGKL